MIRDEHILEAEKILLGDGHFDADERIPFIKNLETRDLLAVPGSGKTTALLAKLYCLSKLMPFEDASGILVLSHTNAAVDEIGKKLRDYCPQLFQYPNFVGTVQSFVNKFFANLGCYEKYGSYITINDNDAYAFEAVKFYASLPWEPNGLRYKLWGLVNHGKNSISNNEKLTNVIEFLKKIELDITNRKITYNGKTKYKYDGSSPDSYLKLEQWKENLFANGILNFMDTFHITHWYLNQFPDLKTLIRERFRYIFIDETQDLEEYQLSLLESIFVSNNSKCTFQRIGDINQSIYHSGNHIKDDCDWKPRMPLLLKNSLRLSNENARIVDYFTLKRSVDDDNEITFNVIGRNDLGQIINPHLILFDTNSMDRLKTTFEELIKKYHLHDSDVNNKRGYKIIGWNGVWKKSDEHNNKLRLENIFSGEFSNEKIFSKEWHTNLSAFLQCIPEHKTLAKYKKNIMMALCTILRLSEKKCETKRRGVAIKTYFTPQLIWDWLNELSQKDDSIITIHDIADFKAKLFTWSFSLATQGDIKATYNDLRTFILDKLKIWFDLQFNNEVASFLGKTYEVTPNSPSNSTDSNQIPIEIVTVHSVKGQTHCATMYVETSFYGKYESEHFMTQKGNSQSSYNPLLQIGDNYRNKMNVRAKQAMKMMYVGFSRPTHLLCYAVLKDNVSGNLETFRSKGWEIIDITYE